MRRRVREETPGVREDVKLLLQQFLDGEEDDVVRILADGSNCHRLEDAEGKQVGSVRNGTIRLRGLASKEDATAATMIVWETLDCVLARQLVRWRSTRRR
jgi:hypothetical protein